MLFPAFHRIDPRRIDAAVPQDIRQLAQILLLVIVGPGEQVAQIVGEDLGARHAAALPEALHRPPDVAAVHGPSAPGDEDGAGHDAAGLHVLLQGAAQLCREDDGADPSLAGDRRRAHPDRLGGDVGKLGHADAGGGDRLHHHDHPLVALAAGPIDQALILPLFQLLLLGTEDLSSYLIELGGVIIPPLIPEEPIQRRDRAVHRDRGQTPLHILLPLDDLLFLQLPPGHIPLEQGQVILVFLDGSPALLALRQILTVTLHILFRDKSLLHIRTSV